LNDEPLFSKAQLTGALILLILLATLCVYRLC
jgi:hypothetical protein